MKQVIVIRKDLNMRKGKMVAQGAHASMAAILDEFGQLSTRKEVTNWLSSSFTKICVGIDSEHALIEIYLEAVRAGLLCSIIKDNGRTEFKGEPTFTAIAIGPGKDEDIDKITGELKLL